MFKEMMNEDLMAVDGGLIEEAAVVVAIIEMVTEAVTGKPASAHVHEAVSNYDSGGSTWGINGY